MLSIAPPGAGKTQTQVIPNLLHWKGPAIVLDVKGELYETTAVWRALNVGPVHRFAPYDPDNSASYNPLTRVRGDNDNIWEDARFLASMMLVPTKSNDPFWQDSAEELIAAAIAATCYERDPEDRSMADVLDIVYRNGWDDFIATLCSADNRSMVRYGKQLMETDADNKTLQSVMKVAQTALRAWSGSKIERVLAGSDWRPEDLRSGSPTIYICVEIGEIEAFASVLRVIIGQHIRALTASLPPEGAQPILFMLDEFPRLKHMAPLEEALEIGRQYGIRLFMIGQSVGQIEQHYQNAKGLMGACGVRVYMNPSLTDGTAQRISTELGEFESPLDGQKKPVATPQDLAGPKYRDKQIVLRRSGKPVCLDKRMAYADPELQARMSMAKPERAHEPPQTAKPGEKSDGEGFVGYGSTYKF